MKSELKTPGQRLRRILEENYDTFAEASRTIGIHRAHLNVLMSGSRNIGEKTYSTLALAGLDTEYIRTGKFRSTGEKGGFPWIANPNRQSFTRAMQFPHEFVHLACGTLQEVEGGIFFTCGQNTALATPTVVPERGGIAVVGIDNTCALYNVYPVTKHDSKDILLLSPVNSLNPPFTVATETIWLLAKVVFIIPNQSLSAFKFSKK